MTKFTTEQLANFAAAKARAATREERKAPLADTLRNDAKETFQSSQFDGLPLEDIQIDFL